MAIDPQFRQRFDREAQAGAALAHQHICTLHDVGRHEDVDFLVMEYLEGETLATCLASGRLTFQRALRYAIEIASALDHAHRHGVVHRDVKPENVMLTSAGAKLMDFGIAKLRSGPGLDATRHSITERGTVLGTVRYMSPEQVEGRDTDHRSDIFSFGAVVYEMFTGRPAFSGSSAASIMAAVLEREPPEMAMPGQLTPPFLDHLVRRCLAKDVGERWQSAGDVLRELKWFADSPDVASGRPDVTAERSGLPHRSSPWRLLPWATAAGLVVASVLIVLWAPWTSPVPPRPFRLRIDAPVAQAIVSSISYNRQLAISPAGTHIVYMSGRYTADSSRTLIVHALGQLEGEPLPGTANAQAPFFSPDGKTVGYFDAAAKEIRKVPIAGGAPRTVCKVDDEVSAASWGSNGVVVFATRSTTTGLISVPSEGGQPTRLTTPDASRNEVDHQFPSVLPDGRTVLFTITRSGGAEKSELAVLETESGRYATLLTGAGNGDYLESGYVVYVSGTTLYGARFDLGRRRISGDPIAVENDIAVERGTYAAQYGVSRTGTLVYIPSSVVGFAAARSLVWVDRQSREAAIEAPSRAYHSLRLSPDGTRVALDVRDEDRDTWVLDFRRPFLQQITFSPRNNPFPVWTPDGEWIVTGDAPGLARWRADGTGVMEALTMSDRTQFPQAFTPNGETLVLTEVVTTGKNNDVIALRVDGKGDQRPLLNQPLIEGPADLSPDGRWLAFQQWDGVGREQIYVSPFPEVSGGRVLVAQGRQPVWARNTPRPELFYIAAAGMLTSAPILTAPTLNVGASTSLFSTKPYFIAGQGRAYDVSSDGRRFVFIKDSPGLNPDVPVNAARGSIVVVLQWIEELKAHLPRN